jgi:hypothetical protein
MKQYQLNNITNALGSYLTARSNKKEADGFMGQVEEDPTMDPYERAALRSAFKRDYSNNADVAKQYLGYRQQKQQLNQQAQYRQAMLSAQSARAGQAAAAQSARQKQGALKIWTSTVSNEKSPYYLDPSNPRSRQAAMEYAKRLGLSDQDIFIPGGGEEAPMPNDLGYDDDYSDYEEDDYEDYGYGTEYSPDY